MTDLNLVFQSLPAPVKDWLGSDFSQNVLNEIGRKYNFDLTKDVVLSQLFLRLVTQDLPPQNFTSTLKSELGLKDDEASETTRVIDEKIIEPINSDLLATGFDRKLLYYSAPPPAKLETSMTPIPTPSPKPVAITPESTPTPFILHEEKELKPSFVETTDDKPSFTFKAPMTTPATPSQPTKVTIERVVHYSDFFTPLNRAPLRYYQKIKIPRSKWFKGFV